MMDIINGAHSSSTNLREGGMVIEESGFIANQTMSLSDSISTLKLLGYGLLIISFCLAIFIPIITSRSIVNPLDTATDIAKRIAAGGNEILKLIFTLMTKLVSYWKH